MKDVDKLLRKAKALLDRIIEVLFPDNEDGFIDCLGVDPEKYKHIYSDGSVGYDFLKALADTAKEDWEDVDDDAAVFYEEPECPETDPESDFSKAPWKYPGWNSMTRAEKQEMLAELGIPEEQTEQYMQYSGMQQNKKAKSRNLFGWG